MSKGTDKSKVEGGTNSSLTSSTTSSQPTRLPGIQDDQVIPSHPRLIKENSNKISTK
jgi:hypothetical protein